jgi:hypothetical protein
MWRRWRWSRGGKVSLFSVLFHSIFGVFTAVPYVYVIKMAINCRDPWKVRRGSWRRWSGDTSWWRISSIILIKFRLVTATPPTIMMQRLHVQRSAGDWICLILKQLFYGCQTVFSCDLKNCEISNNFQTTYETRSITRFCNQVLAEAEIVRCRK